MGADIKKYVIAAKRGDAEAFGELYALYKNEMFRYACIVVGNPVAAEDAVSEAVIEAFENIGSLRSPGSFKGWLFKILNSACKRQYKALNKDLPLIEEADHEIIDPHGIELRELSIDLQEAMSVLNPEDRQIVMMRAVAGTGSREIAEQLGIPDATVRSRYSRAISKLGKILKEGGGNDE